MNHIDLGRISARLMQMDDATWARHANPWSGWSRVSILPLLALAIWSRVWIGWGAVVPVSAVLIWTWANPRLFPAPESTDNWMSRGVLGERLWLSAAKGGLPQHHLRVTRLLNAAAVLGICILGFGLIRLDAGSVLLGLAISMGAKLWFLDRMVWLHSEMGQSTDE